MGESGCGKTTCGRTILKLYPATSGQVIYDGKDVTGKMSRRELKAFKKSAQIIFQDPYSSLDPRMTIAEIVGEGIDVHFDYSSRQKHDKVTELLAAVGLTEEFANRFAHELSGGQRQRVGIARALAVDPDFIVCDEQSLPWMYPFRPKLSIFDQAAEGKRSNLSVHFPRPVHGQAHF